MSLDKAPKPCGSASMYRQAAVKKNIFPKGINKVYY